MESEANGRTNHHGQNVRDIMHFFDIRQYELAEKMGLQPSNLSNVLQKETLDDATLNKIADALGHGITADCIKNYNRDLHRQIIINNQTVNEGGKGVVTITDNSTNFTNSLQDLMQLFTGWMKDKEALIHSEYEIKELKRQNEELRKRTGS